MRSELLHLAQLALRSGRFVVQDQRFRVVSSQRRVGRLARQRPLQHLDGSVDLTGFDRDKRHQVQGVRLVRIAVEDRLIAFVRLPKLPGLMQRDASLK